VKGDLLRMGHQSFFVGVVVGAGAGVGALEGASVLDSAGASLLVSVLDSVGASLLDSAAGFAA
jgi:hypothetical protein